MGEGRLGVLGCVCHPPPGPALGSLFHSPWVHFTRWEEAGRRPRDHKGPARAPLLTGLCSCLHLGNACLKFAVKYTVWEILTLYKRRKVVLVSAPRVLGMTWWGTPQRPPVPSGPGPCVGVGGGAGYGLKDSQRGFSLSSRSTTHLGWRGGGAGPASLLCWHRESSGNFISEPKSLKIGPTYLEAVLGSGFMQALEPSSLNAPPGRDPTICP